MLSKELNELQQRAREMALSENWDRAAIEINTRILEIDDRAQGAYTRLARCFFEQGRFLAAKEMYIQVLTFAPKNRIALNNLARIEREMAEADELERVALIDNYDEAFSVGTAFRKGGRYALAVVALEKAISLRPESLYAWNALGAAYRHKDDLDQARGAYKHAANMARNPVSLIGLAAVARDRGDYDEAIILYTEVLRDDPDQVYALNGLGGVYVDTQVFDKAEECFGRALKPDEGRVEATQGLKMLQQKYELQGDVEGKKRIEYWLAQLSTTRRK